VIHLSNAVLTIVNRHVSGFMLFIRYSFRSFDKLDVPKTTRESEVRAHLTVDD